MIHSTLNIKGCTQPRRLGPERQRVCIFFPAHVRAFSVTSSLIYTSSDPTVKHPESFLSAKLVEETRQLRELMRRHDKTL